MIVKYNDREVEIDVSGFGDHGDEIMVESGVYLDSGESLDDSELDEILEDNFDRLYERQYELYASGAYDRAKDSWKYGD